MDKSKNRAAIIKQVFFNTIYFLLVSKICKNLIDICQIYIIMKYDIHVQIISNIIKFIIYN